IGFSGGAGGDHVGDGDGQSRHPVDDRSRRAMQDGRTRPDHRRDPRRPAGSRQCNQSGGRSHQAHCLPSGRPSECAGSAGPRIRQYAGQESVFSRRRGSRRHRPRRPGSDHPDQPRRQRHHPPCILRCREPRRGRPTPQRGGGNPMTEANSMPPELIRSSILNGQKALVVGVANDRSIAWGCAQAMHLAGAEIAMTYLNEKARPYVEPLASAVEASLLLPLEVRDTAQVDALFAAIASNSGRLDILVHSIAFAPRQALEGRVTDCPRDGFLTAMDVSCWSLLDLTRRAQKLMTTGGTIFAMSYHGANEVIENYGIMGPVQ